MTVHDKSKYVAMTMDFYQKLRELELKQAIIDTQNDLQKGKYHTNIKKHFRQLKI